MGKPGTIWQFVRALFHSTCRTQMLCLLGFGAHANTQNVPHFRAFPACNCAHSPPRFFMANAILPNRPGFALPSVHHSMDRHRCRPELSERSGIWQPFVHVNFSGNPYGQMTAKVRKKNSQRLVLVHGWLFPGTLPFWHEIFTTKMMP